MFKAWQIKPLAGILVLLLSCHTNAQEEFSEFVNGSLYQDSYPGAHGHPFFLENAWTTGHLEIADAKFENLTLKYDLHIDRVIYNHVHPSGVYQVKLNPHEVESFELKGHLFIWLEPGSTEFPGNTGGYFEVLEEGKAILYQKWYKIFNANANRSRGEFTEQYQRYILLNNSYHPVKGRRSLLKIFSDKEKELRTFIRKNHLYPASEQSADIRRVIEFYNALP